MNDVTAVIIAAGEGKRMKSDIPKVLNKLCGRQMIDWVLSSLEGICDNPIMVVGKGSEKIKEHVASRVEYVGQQQQLGTGHAVKAAVPLLQKLRSKYVLIVPGDMPLLTSDVMRELMSAAKVPGFTGALLTACFDNPAGYGRIIREGTDVVKIVEDRDCGESQKLIKECNSSVYCIEREALLWALDKLKCDNAQGEYYMTDCVQILSSAGKRLAGISVDTEFCMGVNDRVQLLEASKVLNRRILESLMLSGVTVMDTDTVYISPEACIGRDTVIYPNNIIEGKTLIGRGCTLYPGSRISNCEIADGVTVQNSVVLSSKIGGGTQVGPYAYLRPGTVIGEKCRIGDFVEIKNSNVGDGTKVSHLSYIGDSDLGDKINVGCGVVFVNYDGKAKYRSTVEDNAFIGCNANIISPVKIGRGSYIAAGSTVTVDVEEDSLCIARGREVIKPGWAKKRREN